MSNGMSCGNATKNTIKVISMLVHLNIYRMTFPLKLGIDRKSEVTTRFHKYLRAVKENIRWETSIDIFISI